PRSAPVQPRNSGPQQISPRNTGPQPLAPSRKSMPGKPVSPENAPGFRPRTDESAGRSTPHRIHKFAESLTSSNEAPPAEDEDPLIGQTPLGQYRILRKVGEGGFGAVYIAEQLGVGRNAVIKVLRKRHEQSDQFIRRFGP